MRSAPRLRTALTVSMDFGRLRFRASQPFYQLNKKIAKLYWREKSPKFLLRV